MFTNQKINEVIRTFKELKEEVGSKKKDQRRRIKEVGLEKWERKRRITVTLKKWDEISGIKEV